MKNWFPVVAFVLCTANVVRAQSIYEPYVFTIFAGTAPGSRDGIGNNARFDNPAGIAVDELANVYVVDQLNSTIRKIDSNGAVTTLAGTAGNIGSTDGTGSAARFHNPSEVALDSSGNLFVTDSGNQTIRKITPAGAVTTFAGLAGAAGSIDGTGSAARFYDPDGIAIDNADNIYVGDTSNHTIRKITPAGVVSTLAGVAGSHGSDDGVGSAARFNRPRGTAVDSSGNICVADSWNSTIRTITPAGMVSTLAGLAGSTGVDDGTGNAARFRRPRSVAADGLGNIFVGDTSNEAVRKIAPGAVVTTFAGLGATPGNADGMGSNARFDHPIGVGVDGAGNLFVADTHNHTVRKITPTAVVTTVAGSASRGSNDGIGGAARFKQPFAATVDNEGNLYVTDTANHTIRKITTDRAVSTLAGLPGNFGSDDGIGSDARFDSPQSVAASSAGYLYVADTANSTIRKIAPGAIVSTFAGLAGSIGSNDGTGNQARFYFPSSVASDAEENLFVADWGNSTIRKISPSGAVITVAGLAGNPGSADGMGSNARFAFPSGVAADVTGNAYVADSNNNTIRKITPDGVVSTLAGLAGSPGSADGTASNARFAVPTGLTVDSAGNLYVADSANATIRKITAAGAVTTLGGLAERPGSAEGSGSNARFNLPWSLSVDIDGRLFVADRENNAIFLGVPQLRMLSAASRKNQGAAGMFDVDLPLSGAPGLECRSGGGGGNHTVVFTFNNNVTSGSASVTGGTGTVGGTPTFSGKTMTVELSNVADAQQISVTVSGVTDTFAQVLPDKTVAMKILLGDVNSSGMVNATDVAQVKSRIGQPVDTTNFRSDVNANGSINAGDIVITKTNLGTGLP